MVSPGPFTGCELSAVQIFFISLLTAVAAYSELRNKPCMSPSAQYLVPSGRSRWSGVIQVSLICNPGYDQPLNSPPMGLFTCRPDGGPWEPDFIPDCNPLTRPANISISLTLDVNKTCTTLGYTTISGDKLTIIFSGGKTINISNSCKLLQSKTDCTFIKVSMPCKDNDFDLKVALTLAYTEIANAILVANGTDGLLEGMAEQLQITSGSGNEATVEGEGCSSGTVGAFDETLGVVCRGCSLGHYLSAVDRTCHPCPPGHFADSPMRERCVVCPGMPPEESVKAWMSINATAIMRGTDISTCPLPVTSVSDIQNVTTSFDAVRFRSGGCWVKAKVTLALTLGCLSSVMISGVIKSTQA